MQRWKAKCKSGRTAHTPLPPFSNGGHRQQRQQFAPNRRHVCPGMKEPQSRNTGPTHGSHGAWYTDTGAETTWRPWRQKRGGGSCCTAKTEQSRCHLRWPGVGWLVATLAGRRGRISERARHRCYKARRTTSRHDHKPMHVGPARAHGGAPAAA